jgi:oxygen-independent coproporphyrinogen-3 oxidase
MPMSGDLSDVGLYFHIPFCSKKCPYCHFFVLLDKSPSLHDELLKALILEWHLLKSQVPKVATVYFGGGTPSLFGAQRVKTLLDEIKKTHSLDGCEITLEVNPEKVTHELMEGYKQAQINRISLGVQSLETPLLQEIGRTHDSLTALRAIETIKQVGFDNITIDLMYDLPNQTAASFEKTLKKAITLPIDHVSLYNLQIEPNTVFYKTRPQQPTTDESLLMYQKAMTVLEEGGFKQYEISAFAKKGFEAQHNSRYWLSKPFLGLGPSAFSDFQGERRQNVSHLNKYLKKIEEGLLPIDFRETLPYPQNVLERFIVNLRLLEGVSLDKWDLPQTTLLTLNRLASLNLLEIDERRVKLTKKGIFLFDSIAVELV